MSKENLLLQYDLFSGELVDTRSNSQKNKDKERSTPQQTKMFKTSEIVQFGGNAKSVYRDWLDHATAPPLVLQVLDTRTADEIEHDLMHDAEKLTTPLFGEDAPTSIEDKTSLRENTSPQLQPTVIFDAKKHHCQRGLRARLRAEKVPVRQRN